MGCSCITGKTEEDINADVYQKLSNKQFFI